MVKITKSRGAKELKALVKIKLQTEGNVFVTVNLLCILRMFEVSTVASSGVSRHIC